MTSTSRSLVTPGVTGTTGHQPASFSPARLARTTAACALLALTTAAHAVSVDVLATGLDNPRGIALGPLGTILIAEAGAGGLPPTRTGHITVYARGRVTRLLTLPSVTVPSGEVSGPSSIAYGRTFAQIFMTQGGGGGGLPPPFGDLLRIHPVSTSFVADIAQHEYTNNPDGVMPPDSNPNSVAVLADGSKLVVDAGANTLVQVDRNGTVHTVAVFPTLPNPMFAPPPAASVGGPTVQSVPTSVAIGPDGAWYVGELRGFPFVVPSHIWRIEPGARDVHCAIGAASGACVDWLGGLRHVVSIAFGPDGDLYVSQYGPGPGPPFLPGWATPGAVMRVDFDTKAVTTVYSGLTAPGGIALDDDGTIYVTSNSSAVGTGQLLRIRP